jgi:hypothetical protein
VVLVKNTVAFAKATPTVRRNTNTGFAAGPAGATQHSGFSFTQAAKQRAEDSIRGWRRGPQSDNSDNIDESADYREPLFSRPGDKYQAIEIDPHALRGSKTSVWHAHSREGEESMS